MNRQNQEYQRVAQIISELLTLDEDMAQKINISIQSYGIGHFLDNLEAFDLSQEAILKLQNLKTILDRYSEHRQELDLDGNGGVDQHDSE